MDAAVHECRMRLTMRRYALMRGVFIAALAATAFATWELLEIHIPLPTLAAILVLHTLINVVFYVRLRRPRPVSDGEIFVQTLLDVAGLSALLYFTGGTLNPFAYCYLLLVLFAATVLPQRYGWTLAGACVVCYSILQVHYVPLPLPDSAETHANLDELARWVMYVLLAGLVAWFALRLKDLRSEHYRHLEAEAEDAARERYLLGLATLAAGTAHELGTPLSTMSVVVGDLRRNPTPPADWKESIDMLWQQIEICKHSLSNLAKATDPEQLGKARVVPARHFLESLVDHFSLLRPGAAVSLSYGPRNESIALRVDHTLQQALLSLVSNAADASPDAVELQARVADRFLEVRILDRGPGISPRLRERLGKGPVGPRRGGHGLGLLIANSAIERLGGSVRLLDREGGGTCALVRLPVHEPAVNPNPQLEREAHAAG